MTASALFEGVSDTRRRTPHVASEPEDDLDRIAMLLRERGLVDLTSYRGTTVQRRLGTRMQRMGVPDLGSYLQLLRSQPAEAEELVRYLRIGVTRLFRNPTAFAALRVALGERASGPLRVWSAGCSSGEEVYSLLMLIDTMPDGARDSRAAVLATDIDARQLARAHPDRTRFSLDALAELPEALRSRYLEYVPKHLSELRPSARLRELAGQVTWRAHDLLTTTLPAPGPFEVISCRNVMIYFAPHEQGRIQSFLADQLVPGGLLFLGEAEALSGAVSDRFDVVNQDARLFRLRRGEAHTSR